MDMRSNTFIEKRVEEITVSAKNTKKCRELTSKIMTLQGEILKRLPQDSKTLLFQYEEAETERDGITYEKLYRQGVLDGIRMTKAGRRTETPGENDL